MRKWIYSLLILTFTIIFLVRFCIQETRSVKLVPSLATVQGVVEGYPIFKVHHTRFSFRVDHLGLIKLNWYGRRPLLYPGQQLTLVVRLHSAYQHNNYGLFLWHRGYSAYGYVKKNMSTLPWGKKPKLDFGDDNHFRRHMLFLPEVAISQYRESLRFKILHLLGEVHCPRYLKGKILSLAIGDRSLLSHKDWQVLQDTGTSHLVAISGLHIGLIAYFFYWMVKWLWSRSIYLTHRFCSAQKAGLLVGFFIALFYAILSGFQLPAQRAIMMLAAVCFFQFNNRSQPALHILALSFIGTLALHPWAIFSMSFWMSFLAVFCLYYVVYGRLGKNSMLRKMFFLQFALTLLLLPISIYNFGVASVISFWVNLWAIPWVSFIVVPLVFLMLVFLAVKPLALTFAWLAKYASLWWWEGLKWFEGIPHSSGHLHLSSLTQLMLCQVGVFILFLPGKCVFRYSGLFLILPIFMPSMRIL